MFSSMALSTNHPTRFVSSRVLVGFFSYSSLLYCSTYSVRQAGLIGLTSLLPKATIDDVAFWQQTHLAKLVPTMLSSMEM